MTRREILDSLRRIVSGMLGAAMMLLAVFRMPFALLERDALESFALLALASLGLWLIRLSRPADPLDSGEH